jgi:DNA-binding CsgD family transcriptional regulator
VRTAYAIVLAALIGGVLAAPATAAPYTVWSCRDAAGAPLSTAAWIPAGNSLPDIAARLGIALGTVKNHVTNVYTKIGATSASTPLARRELEILALLAAGNSTPDVAKNLGISPGTVKAHLTSVYKKIGAQNRVQAARYYLDHLAPPEQASR